MIVVDESERKKEKGRKKERERFLGEGVIFKDNSFEEFAKDPLRFINGIKI